MSDKEEIHVTLRRSSRRTTRASVKVEDDKSVCNKLEKESKQFKKGVKQIGKPENLEENQDYNSESDEDDSGDDDYDGEKRGRKAKTCSKERSTQKSPKKGKRSNLVPPKKSTKADEVSKKDTNPMAKGKYDDIDICYQMSDKEMKEVNKVFDANCAPGSEEQLTEDDLKTALRAVGFEPSSEEIHYLANKFSNSNKKINRDGFHKIMNLKLGSTVGRKENDLPSEIAKVFDLLDVGKTGFLSFENLRAIAEELNEAFTDEELNEMIEGADLDGDKQINQMEFFNIMKRTNLY